MAGEAAFLKKLAATMPAIEKEVNAKYRELGRKMFTDLVMNTPQWSGNLVNQWHIGRGAYSPISDYDPVDWYRDDPYQMGEDPGVAGVLLREVPKLAAITYKMPIRFINSAPYASQVESEQGPNGKPIRRENKLASYGGVAMLGYIDMKYRTLKAR